MTKLEFDNLSLEERIMYATSGKYVSEVKYYGYIVKLYSVNTEFYEVFFHPVQNEINSVSMCDDYDLKKFLPAIKI